MSRKKIYKGLYLSQVFICAQPLGNGWIVTKMCVFFFVWTKNRYYIMYTSFFGGLFFYLVDLGFEFLCWPGCLPEDNVHIFVDYLLLTHTHTKSYTFHRLLSIFQGSRMSRLLIFFSAVSIKQWYYCTLYMQHPVPLL